MAILKRIRAALTPGLKVEDLLGEDAFTPAKDFGEYLGAGYGIETPRARQRRETVQAEHDLQLGMIEGRLGNQLESLLGMDESAEHREIVRQLAERSGIVSTMLRSPYAEMQATGREELASLMADIRESGLAVETRRVQDAALEAAGVKEAWDNFSGLYDDLYRESSDFLEINGSFSALQSAYAGGLDNAGNANDIAAVNSLQRMIDPGVSVREGDVSMLANLAGVPDVLVTAANRVMNEGARFTPEQRAALLALGNDLMRSRNVEQTARNARFQSQGEAAGLTPRLLRELALPITDTGPPRPSSSSSAPEDRDSQPDRESPGQVIKDTVQGVRDMEDEAASIYSAARAKVADIFATVGSYDDFAAAIPMPFDRLPARMLERAEAMRQPGDRLYANPETGRVFLRNENGGEPREVDTITLGDAFSGRDNQGPIRRYFERLNSGGIRRGVIERPTN